MFSPANAKNKALNDERRKSLKSNQLSERTAAERTAKLARTYVNHLKAVESAAAKVSAARGPPTNKGTNAADAAEYKEQMLSESGCGMFGACFVLLWCAGVIFLTSGLSLKTEQPMIAFTEQPMQYLDATVLSSGVSYTCGDIWGGTPSIDCVDDERACLGIADQLHPTSADVAAVERMHDSRHYASRELGSCTRHYTPWLKVMLYDGAEEMVRCAYKYGTRANTRFMWESSQDDANTFIAAHPIASRLRVWSLPTPRRCLVGVAEVTDLASATKQRTTIYVLVEIGIVLLFGSHFLCSLCRYILALTIPTNPLPEHGRATLV